MKFKIFNFFVLLFSFLDIVFSVEKIFVNVRSNIEFSDFLTPNEIIGNYIDVFFYAFTIFVCIFIIVKIILSLRLKNIHHFIRYTYEEYKEKRDKQKLQKQAEDKQEKIENLKQQLSDLENTD